jgi:hypothetical protein
MVDFRADETSPAADEPRLIDLGVAGDDVAAAGPSMPARLSRGLVAVLTAVLSLLALGASAAGAPAGLEGPLWTGTVSLNGFTLGSASLYQASTDARTVMGRDVATGRLRWSLAVDRADLPAGTTDVGHGVAAVLTRRLAQEPERPEFMITLVRESTGEVIARTRGYFYPPGAAADPLVVFSQRDRGADCPPRLLSCVDVTAWDVGSGAVRWRRFLPGGTTAIPSFRREFALDGLAEVDADGTVRMIDLATGAVAGTIRLTAAHLSRGQVLLTRDAFVTALRVSGGIVVTGYRRPALTRIWTATVDAARPPDDANDEFRGGVQLAYCGPEFLCLYADRVTGRIIAVDTGVSSAPTPYRPIVDTGRGLFVAETLADASRSSNGADVIVDHTGRVVADLAGAKPVPWEDGGGRVLVSRQGRTGTEFSVIDDRRRRRGLATVAGTDLSCQARGRYLSCSDPAGDLRTWRLPPT